MSAISLKSITGITSITTPAGVDDQLTLHNNNTTEAVKLDVAGNVHVNNHLAIAGVSTFSDDIKIPVTNKKLIIGASGQLQLYNQGYHSRIDHVGNHWLAIRSNAIALQDASDNYYFDGRQSTGSARLWFSNNPKLETTNTGINVTGGAVFTSTDAGSAAEPEVVLYRNSASPADADYLGQIKFNGKSDTGAQRTYAKMTGKILDASNGTEDGIIEFAHIKGGSQNISARFRSDSLQLLNSTSLTVAGTTTLSDSLSVNADNKYIKIGAGDDLAFVHTGGQSYITNATGHLTQRSASYTWENSAGSTEYARIDSNGDVGISSIAPRARLDVKDANTSHPVILRVSADNATPYALVVGNDTHNTDANNGLAMWVGGSKTHHIQARTSETASENKLEIEAYETTIQTGSSMNQNFVFDSSGRLLMNGAASGNAFSGGDDLIIGNSSSARSGITLVSESSNDGGLYFSKGTSSNSDHVMGQIVYQHDNNGGYLRLYTNTSEKVRITSDGNLLLGTTSDTQRLHVYNGNGAAGYKTALFNSNDTANGTRIVFANSGNTSGRGLGINVGGQTYGPGQNKASFGWYNTDNTFATYHSIMTITSDAKIGIKETSPDNLLHITTNDSTAYSTSETNTVNATNALLRLENTNGSDGSGVNNYVGIYFRVANGANSDAQLQYVREGDNKGAFHFKARNAGSTYPNLMTIKSNGNTRIGVPPTTGSSSLIDEKQATIGTKHFYTVYHNFNSTNSPLAVNSKIPHPACGTVEIMAGWANGNGMTYKKFYWASSGNTSGCSQLFSTGTSRYGVSTSVGTPTMSISGDYTNFNFTFSDGQGAKMEKLKIHFEYFNQFRIDG